MQSAGYGIAETSMRTSRKQRGRGPFALDLCVQKDRVCSALPAQGKDRAVVVKPDGPALWRPEEIMKSNRLLIASVVAIATTSFGFIVRANLITEWGNLYNLTETQKGALQGAGLFPFALSIILFSLIIDKIGYGRSMAFAWTGHVVAAIVTMTASSYT